MESVRDPTHLIFQGMSDAARQMVRRPPQLAHPNAVPHWNTPKRCPPLDYPNAAREAAPSSAPPLLLSRCLALGRPAAALSRASAGVRLHVRPGDVGWRGDHQAGRVRRRRVHC
eukprot:3523885-Prymnesium_polylepis.2